MFKVPAGFLRCIVVRSTGFIQFPFSEHLRFQCFCVTVTAVNSVHSLSVWTCYVLILTLESFSCLSCTATFHSDVHECWLQYVSDV